MLDLVAAPGVESADGAACSNTGDTAGAEETDGAATGGEGSEDEGGLGERLVGGALVRASWMWLGSSRDRDWDGPWWFAGL